MKNKWMSREVQGTLPENYICCQCGVVKIFCAYSNKAIDHEWRDPGIVGVASVITSKEDFSCYIRIYEFDKVIYMFYL